MGNALSKALKVTPHLNSELAMINTLLNVLLTPTTVATLPPEVPAIVQTYNWQTQTTEIAPATPDSSIAANFPTFCWVYPPGKAPISLPDDQY